MSLTIIRYIEILSCLMNHCCLQIPKDSNETHKKVTLDRKRKQNQSKSATKCSATVNVRKF